jgi:aminopeptidase N
VPSLLRGFSAPVILDDGLSETDLLVLLAHDSDPFNRWEAGQRLALAQMLPALADDRPARLEDGFIQSMRGVLRHPTLDPAFKELVLTLPSEAYVAEQLTPFDPQRIHAVREQLRQQLAEQLHADWVWAFEQHQVRQAYQPTPGQAGQRAVANLALGMLCLHAVTCGDPVWPGRALQRFKDAGNMTDRLGALASLVASHSPLAEAALDRLHTFGRNDALVVDKWFMLQAAAPEPLGDGAGRVFTRAKALLKHPDFSIRNPNRARSLIFSLCMHNPAAFHRKDAAGYVFWAERLLELDAINPQVAARLARVMDRWAALAEPYRSAAREAIARVAARPDLSADTREVIGRALEAT